MKKLLSFALTLALVVSCLAFSGISVSAANDGDTLDDFAATFESGLWVTQGGKKLNYSNGILSHPDKVELEKLWILNKKFTNFDIQFELRAENKIENPQWLGAIALRDKVKNSMYANDTAGMNVYLQFDSKNYQVQGKGLSVIAPRSRNIDDENAVAVTYPKHSDLADGKWHTIRMALCDSPSGNIMFFYAVDGQTVAFDEFAKVSDDGYLTMFQTPGSVIELRASTAEKMPIPDQYLKLINTPGATTPPEFPQSVVDTPSTPGTPTDDASSDNTEATSSGSSDISDNEDAEAESAVEDVDESESDEVDQQISSTTEKSGSNVGLIIVIIVIAVLVIAGVVVLILYKKGILFKK